MLRNNIGREQRDIMKISARAPVRGNKPMSARFERRKILRQLKKRIDKLRKRRKKDEDSI